jgi:hypothetical protein
MATAQLECLPSGDEVVNLTGATYDCAPTACDTITGTCKPSCTTTNDCAGGYVCDVVNKICVWPT